MRKSPVFLTACLSVVLGLSVSLSSEKVFAQDDFESEFMEAEGEYAEPMPLDDSTNFNEGLNTESTPMSNPESPSDLQFSETPTTTPRFDSTTELTPSYVEADTSTMPAARPRFVKPKGPPGGGVLRVPHPDPGKGLLRIEKDGVYVYKTKIPEKSRSASVRAAFQSSPSIVNPQGVNFQDIYGADGLVGLLGEYEWQFRKFGSFGLQLGSGLVYARGNGRFASGEIAQEIYNLIVIPISAAVVYRFEYMSRQWFVPFAIGGGTLYNMAEIRDDGDAPNLASSPAVFGGGGVHLSISAWDRRGAFILASDYGIADLWFTVEARVIQGLSQDLDFTNQTISGGFTVDF